MAVRFCLQKQHCYDNSGRVNFEISLLYYGKSTFVELCLSVELFTAEVSALATITALFDDVTFIAGNCQFEIRFIVDRIFWLSFIVCSYLYFQNYHNFFNFKFR